MSLHAPNQYRCRRGPLASEDSDGNNGAFFIPGSEAKRTLPLTIICSDGEGWEHVSVSTPVRCPLWREMCMVKDLFWDEEDLVLQFHPPRSEYVNNHNFCLHMWRPTSELARKSIPIPSSVLVGVKL